MKSLYLHHTNGSPKILLNADSGFLLMEGKPFDRNATSLYPAIVSWLKHYFVNPREKTVLEIGLEYLNAGSARMLINILREINKFYISGSNVLVRWKYTTYDEEMKALGHDLHTMVDVPFEFGVLK